MAQLINETILPAEWRYQYEKGEEAARANRDEDAYVFLKAAILEAQKEERPNLMEILSCLKFGQVASNLGHFEDSERSLLQGLFQSFWLQRWEMVPQFLQSLGVVFNNEGLEELSISALKAADAMQGEIQDGAIKLADPESEGHPNPDLGESVPPAGDNQPS